MRQVTSEEARSPSLEHDPEVVAFRAQFDGRSPLDELVHRGLSRCCSQRNSLQANTPLPPATNGVGPAATDQGMLLGCRAQNKDGWRRAELADFEKTTPL